MLEETSQRLTEHKTVQRTRLRRDLREMSQKNPDSPFQTNSQKIKSHITDFSFKTKLIYNLLCRLPNMGLLRQQLEWASVEVGVVNI